MVVGQAGSEGHIRHPLADTMGLACVRQGTPHITSPPTGSTIITQHMTTAHLCGTAPHGTPQPTPASLRAIMMQCGVEGKAHSHAGIHHGQENPMYAVGNRTAKACWLAWDICFSPGPGTLMYTAFTQWLRRCMST
ncbi:hypothetical protein HaLaN_11618 [Haematococcus lacustris]|uniref:Uncharacterized protein n=1 Tax=Haematococcus lacustris TaxID=44745 RepID=A0A699Z1L0_HAELA|nr:hypothetical protein HaLaN_11618 [Haematococcus lacustris]